jgi:hypothetical protein
VNFSHYDVVVILAVSFAIQLSCLAFIAWLVWNSRGMLAESQRLTRAVGALVVQESDKIRTLLDRG